MVFMSDALQRKPMAQAVAELKLEAATLVACGNPQLHTTAKCPLYPPVTGPQTCVVWHGAWVIFPSNTQILRTYTPGRVIFSTFPWQAKLAENAAVDAALNFKLSASYHNHALVVWEPLLEPWSCELLVEIPSIPISLQYGREAGASTRACQCVLASH